MPTDHKNLAASLRQRVETTPGEVSPGLRRDIVARIAGGSPLPSPYDSLVTQIGEAAYQVTDAEVAAVRTAAGGDKGAFEVVMAAAIGAGLYRWGSAMRALEEASDASA